MALLADELKDHEDHFQTSQVDCYLNQCLAPCGTFQVRLIRLGHRCSCRLLSLSRCLILRRIKGSGVIDCLSLVDQVLRLRHQCRCLQRSSCFGLKYRFYRNK